MLRARPRSASAAPAQRPLWTTAARVRSYRRADCSSEPEERRKRRARIRPRIRELHRWSASSAAAAAIETARPPSSPLPCRGQRHPKLLHPQPNASLRRPQRLREPLGDLLLRKAAEVRKLNDLALLLWYLRQGSKNQPPLVRKLHRQRRVVSVGRRQLPFLLLGRRGLVAEAAPPRADFVHGTVTRGRRQT